MTEQEKRLAKKLGRPATGRGQTVGVRLQPDILAKLDAFIAAQPKPFSRPEAIRRMVAVLTGPSPGPEDDPMMRGLKALGRVLALREAMDMIAILQKRQGDPRLPPAARNVIGEAAEEMLRWHAQAIEEAQAEIMLIGDEP